MSLTEDQARVLDFADHYNMVCALPGSGKTHTSIALCQKILSLDPSYSVALVTFTKDAAKELKDRVNRLCGDSAVGRVEARTFHSYALEQWRQKYKAFKLIIGTEATNYVNRAVKMSTYKGAYGDAGAAIDFYGQQLYPVKPQKDPDNTWALYQAYDKLIKNVKGLDLSMVCRNVRLGMLSEEIKPLNYTHMIIDEFQDTDDVQYAWLKAHGEAGIKITVVGDDDQSIYGFRNSKGYEALKQFQEGFDAIGHVLSICFRCKPEILLAAQTVIEFNEERVPKKMLSHCEPGGEVRITQVGNSQEELVKVYEILKQKVGERWAILARNNVQLDSIQGYLSQMNVEVEREDSSSFWDIIEVNCFMKLLYSIRYPYNSKYLNEVLGFLEEDEDLIMEICKKAKKDGGFMMVTPQDRLWRPTTVNIHKSWAQIGQNTENEEMIRKRMATIMNWIRDAKGKTKTNKEGKLLGLAAANAVANMVAIHGEGDLHERIDSIIYRLRPKPEKEDEDNEEKEGPLITLKTLHGSKGLEYPNVIIVGVNEGLLPSSKCSSVDEERRLLYVGMTRAELYLHMLCFGTPSEFLQQSFPGQFEKDEFDDLTYEDSLYEI
jgi:DNA helicase-2/ATP-dependent DNA helicase PcrA